MAQKITILRDGRKEKWNYIDSIETLNEFNKKHRSRVIDFVAKTQKQFLKEGKELLINDEGGYNFLLSSDKILKIK